MIVIVEFLVDRRVGRPEISTQIDDCLARLPQGHDVRRSGTVRHSQKEKIGLFGQGEIRFGRDKSQRAQFAWEAMNGFGKRFASALPGGDQTETKYRMPGKIMQQFLSGIAGSSNDRRAYGLQLWPFFAGFQHMETDEKFSVWRTGSACVRLADPASYALSGGDRDEADRASSTSSAGRDQPE